MTTMSALQATKRSELGKGFANRLRKSGWVPGIIYGNKRDPIAVKVNQKEVETVFNAEEKMHQPIEVTLADSGKAETVLVLLKEYQADIISRQFSHLDFVQILPNETIAVSVPLRMVGRAQGVKQGGELKVFARKVRLVCLPKDTPAVVEFDTTPLAIGYVVHFSEISLPEGCKLAPNTEKLPLVCVIEP